MYVIKIHLSTIFLKKGFAFEIKIADAYKLNSFSHVRRKENEKEKPPSLTVSLFHHLNRFYQDGIQCKRER
jgi:hypothetical protein